MGFQTSKNPCGDLLFFPRRGAFIPGASKINGAGPRWQPGRRSRDGGSGRADTELPPYSLRRRGETGEPLADRGVDVFALNTG